MPIKFVLRSTMAAAALMFASAAPPGAALAQEAPTLTTLTELKCVFPVMSIGTWTNEGDPTAEVKKSEFTLVYQAIDTQDGSAQVKGYTGNLYITVRLVAGNLHLLTTDSSGPVYMTTVFNTESHKGKFKAAHSRHEFTRVSLPGFTSRPEQYIGECEIVK